MRRRQLKIHYMDETIIVCEKPAGIPVQSDKSRDIDLETLLKLEIAREESNEPAPYLTAVHRLDRPVGGLMVYARSKKAAADMSRQMREGQFEKNYQAIVCGELPEEVGTFSDYLIRDGKNNTSKVVDKGTAGAKYAVLDYELIDSIETEKGVLSWVLIILRTGRHHQIRVQFASRSLALYGDTKYNPEFSSKVFDKKRTKTKRYPSGKLPGRQKAGGHLELGLYATRLSFPHPVTGERMVFKTEPKGSAFDLMDVEAF